MAPVDVLVDVLGAVWFAMLLIAVHEHGHRLVALAAGVPGAEVRVVLDGRPPHTALWDGMRWLAPDDRGFQEAFRRRAPQARWAWAFVAGGLAVETAVSTAVTFLLVALGADEVAEVLAGTTLGLFLVYLAGDLALTWRRGAPAGDHSALWHINQPATAALIAAVAALKIAALTIAW